LLVFFPIYNFRI